jgi:hypothetical protein
MTEAWPVVRAAGGDPDGYSVAITNVSLSTDTVISGAEMPRDQ